MASISLGFSSLPSTWVGSTSHTKHASTSFFFKNSLHSLKIAPSFTSSSFSSSSSSSLPFSSKKWRRPVSAASEVLDTEGPPVPEADELSVDEGEEVSVVEAEPVKEENIRKISKGEETFAVVMVGSRQYIVFPGRYIYTQRLKGANVNDKIILNKVLLVNAGADTYIGKPVLPNTAVHAVVEEQGLNTKVVVYKYKKRKHYRRNIGHRQPNTRIRITGITGYETAPKSLLPVAA